MVAIFAVMSFFIDNPRELGEVFADLFIGAAFLLLFFIVIGSLHLLPGFVRIAKQEAFFGIRFRDEMQNEQIRETEHVSRSWFISAQTAGVIVFRAGFITRIDEVESYYRGPIASQIMITTANGRKMKIVGHYETINSLLKWQKGDLPKPAE